MSRGARRCQTQDWISNAMHRLLMMRMMIMHHDHECVYGVVGVDDGDGQIGDGRGCWHARYFSRAGMHPASTTRSMVASSSADSAILSFFSASFCPPTAPTPVSAMTWATMASSSCSVAAGRAVIPASSRRRFDETMDLRRAADAPTLVSTRLARPPPSRPTPFLTFLNMPPEHCRPEVLAPFSWSNF
jgi:hypothetical protein